MYFKQLILTVLSLLALHGTALCGALDDQYLAAYGDTLQTVTSSALQKAVLLPTNGLDDLPHCGTPLKHALQRDWSKLEATTQKTLAKQVEAPVLSGSELILPSPSRRFQIHYTRSGLDAPPLADSNSNGIPDWVETVAQTFDNVSDEYLLRLWNLAPTLSTSNGMYDIYLRDLSAQKLYGQTTSGQQIAPGINFSFGSSIEIDNDFLDPIYQNALSGPLSSTQKALQSLQITAAHEYHHAIQYGYNFFFDVWYAEATSTWFEDELYDNVNQLYTYLSASLRNTNLSLDIPADLATGGGYSRWLVNRHLSEAHGGQAIIKNIWERLAATSPIGNSDIAMAPIINTILTSNGSSLGNDLFGYADKLYTNSWTGHRSDISLIPGNSMVATFSSLPINATSPATPALILPHYSYAFFKITPPAGAPGTVTFTVARDTGISARAFSKTGTVITPFNINGSNQIVVTGFNTASEVVLLFTNTTANDRLMASFSSDGSSIGFALPGTAISSISATTTPPSTSLSWSPVTGAVSYQVYRSVVSSTTLTLYSTVTVPSFTDSGVVNDHTYYYAIVPVSAQNFVGPMSEVRFVKVSASTAAAVSGGGGGGGGCFIATAAYGSYLHPRVRTLREFRDTWLMGNAPGRAFVSLYYRLSPPLAQFIAQHETLRLLVRVLLTPVILIVSNLLLTAIISVTLLMGLIIRRFCRRTGLASASS